MISVITLFILLNVFVVLCVLVYHGCSCFPLYNKWFWFIVNAIPKNQCKLYSFLIFNILSSNDLVFYLGWNDISKVWCKVQYMQWYIWQKINLKNYLTDYNSSFIYGNKALNQIHEAYCLMCKNVNCWYWLRQQNKSFIDVNTSHCIFTFIYCRIIFCKGQFS